MLAVCSVLVRPAARFLSVVLWIMRPLSVMTSRFLPRALTVALHHGFHDICDDDVSDNNTNIGPISDSDTTPNQVEENSAVGTSVGIIASAIDADIGDNVTYTHNK